MPCLLLLVPSFLSTQSRVYELEDRRDEAAAFINRETDGNVSSSAAGRRGNKKKKKKDLAGCPTQSIDDKQHVDTVLPFMRGVKTHYSGYLVGKQWHSHADRFPL